MRRLKNREQQLETTHVPRSEESVLLEDSLISSVSQLWSRNSNERLIDLVPPGLGNRLFYPSLEKTKTEKRWRVQNDNSNSIKSISSGRYPTLIERKYVKYVCAPAYP